MRSLLFFLLPLCTLAQNPSDTDLHWLNTATLAERVEAVRLIGLGEATHGTRELYQLRHALTAHLIEQQQVRLILIEAAHLRCVPLNQYLQGEAITLDSALRATGRWMWQTESVRQIMSWLRAYNQGQPAAERVRLYGVDQDHYDASGTALRRALLVLPKGDSLSRAVRRTLDLDTTASAWRRVQALSRPEAKARLAYLHSLSQYLSRLDSNLLAPGQRRAWREARYHVQNLTEAWRYADSSRRGSYGGYLSVRDPAMAWNIRWHMAGLRPGERAVFWAHNEHIEHGSINFPGAGRSLREAMGSAYYALALTTGPGHCLVSKLGVGGLAATRLSAPTRAGASPGGTRAGHAMGGFSDASRTSPGHPTAAPEPPPGRAR